MLKRISHVTAFHKLNNQFLSFALGLVTMCCLPVMGQEVDQLSVMKIWVDDNGDNELYIDVSAACNNYDAKNNFARQGVSSTMHVRLKNDRNVTYAILDAFDTSKEMLLFYEEGVWYQEINEIQAVFIPVFYCTPFLGAQMPLSYVILYDGQQYTFRFNYDCKDGVDGGCSLPMSKKQLSQRLSDLPEYLREPFIKYLRKVYTTREDLFPNHHSFLAKRYPEIKEPFDLATAYHASYPQVILSNIADFMRDKNYDLAKVYLDEFTYLYVQDVHRVVVAGVYIAPKSYQDDLAAFERQAVDDPEALLDDIHMAIYATRYQDAYLALYAWYTMEVDTKEALPVATF